MFNKFIEKHLIICKNVHSKTNIINYFVKNHRRNLVVSFFIRNFAVEKETKSQTIMENYKTLNEINTTHFFLVSVDNNDGTFGYDELLPTKEDCTKYITEQTHHIIPEIEKGIIVVKEYNLSIKDVEWLINSTQVFFDNIDRFDKKCKIIETLNIGN